MKPRVLQLCAVDFTAYHFLLPLMRAQREWGFEVELACAPGVFVPAIQAEGFPVRAVPISRSKNPLKLIQGYRGLRKLFKTADYTVVHVHTPVAALLGRPAARRSGVPLVLYTAHGFYFHDRMSPLVRAVYIALERWAQRKADFLFSQSEEDLQTAVACKIAPLDRAMTIGNGVDLQKFRPDLLRVDERAEVRAGLGIKPGEGPVVTMMGRLVREKGYLEFLKAWAKIRERFPNARAVVIGEALPSEHDRSAEEIHAKVNEFHLADCVIFAGLRRDVPRLLAASDLFVLPSWREGMPRSILEAMASGLPVIASDIRGCREEVVDSRTGRLIPPRDADALADALAELLASPDLRKKVGEAGRRRAEEFFSEEMVIEKQKKVYRRLFADKNIPWPE